MRARIVGVGTTIEVIAEEFAIDGTGHRFIVHAAVDTMRANGDLRRAFVATHLETSQIIGEGDTIDAAIAEGKRRWLAAPADLIEAKLIERRQWVADRIAEQSAMGGSQ